MHTGVSRRNILKGMLKTSAYATPLILSATYAREVAAVSPLPSSPGTVTFSPFGSGFVGEGGGLPAGLPFLFLLADPNGGVLAMRVVTTDGAGNFSLTINPVGYTVGSHPAPARVNGGNLFVNVADTGGGVSFPGFPTSTPAPTRGVGGPVAATATAIAAQTAAARAKGP